MDKVELERIRNKLWSQTSPAIFSREARILISDIIDALFKEEREFKEERTICEIVKCPYLKIKENRDEI